MILMQAVRHAHRHTTLQSVMMDLELLVTKRNQLVCKGKRFARYGDQGAGNKARRAVWDKNL